MQKLEILRQLVTLLVILFDLHLGRLEQIENDGELNFLCVWNNNTYKFLKNLITVEKNMSRADTIYEGHQECSELPGDQFDQFQ